MNADREKLEYVASRVRMLRGYLGDWDDIDLLDKQYWLTLAQNHIDIIQDYEILNKGAVW